MGLIQIQNEQICECQYKYNYLNTVTFWDMAPSLSAAR
jgi:hypothetical protein